MTQRARLEAGVVAALDRANNAPMAWGVDDCALWAADVVRDVLGYDPAKKFRGRYTTRNGARRVMGPNGLKGAVRLAARRHGWQRIKPEMAQPGDAGLAWTLVEIPGRPATSVLATVICRAQGWFVGRNERGFTAIKAHDVVAAWSVLPVLPWQPGRRAAMNRPATRPNMGAPLPAGCDEPISIAIGLTALLSGTILAGTGGFIITAVLAVGFSLVSSLLAPHLGGSVGQPDTPQSVQITERQSLPPKRVILGSAYVGGALFFEQVKPPYLYQGILINYGAVTSVDSVAIGTNTLQFSTITPNAILTPIPVAGQPAYPTRLQLSLRYGAIDQATDTLIATDFPTLATNVIDPATGTRLGNATSYGGLAAAFDGQPYQVTTQCSAVLGTGNLTATIGKDWGVGITKTIQRFRVYVPSDLPFSNSADGTVTVYLEGSTDNFASSIVALKTIAAIQYQAAGVIDVAAGIVTSTAYRYHRVRLVESTGDVTAHSVAIAEVQFFDGTNGNEFRQRGITTAVLRYHYGGTDNTAATQAAFIALWGQVQRPNAFFLVKGGAVYDPRDAVQSLTDPTTWKWTNNATLVQTYYLTQSWGGRISTDKIDWVKTIDSANYDDEVIACRDGTLIPRHTIDGCITLDQTPATIMPLLLAANRAFLLESAGKVWIQSSRPRTLIVTIHDGILTGGVKYQASKPKKDLVNKLQVRFVAPTQDYQLVDGPILERTDLEATDQQTLPATLALNFTQDVRRAQRLQKAFLATARLGRTITCTVDTAIMAQPGVKANGLIGQAVTFASSLFAAANGTYLVMSVGFADDFSAMSLALTEYDATIETDWNPLLDEQPFVLGV